MAEEDDDNERLEERDVAEQYLELSKRGGSRGTIELQRMVERKKAKGQQLCLGFKIDNAIGVRIKTRQGRLPRHPKKK